jgi:hypothetical protein
MTKLFSLLLAAAFAFAAGPADAKTSKHRAQKHKYVRVSKVHLPATKHWGTDKFPAGPLYYNGGMYMGDDPDPFIRSQIWRDVSGRFGGEN